MFHADDTARFAAALPTPGRLVGLDVGTKTIGVAVSDPGRLVASPRTTLTRRKFGQDAYALLELYAEVDACGWVVGLPLSMDGGHSAQTQRATRFAQEFARRHPAPLLLWDERMSTLAVERMMIQEADLSRARRDALVDKLAAAYFLQGCLDYLKNL